jgi:hypothetical protein
MAKSKTAKRYTPEFREQLVKLHRAGRSIPELAREFGLGLPRFGGRCRVCDLIFWFDLPPLGS